MVVTPGKQTGESYIKCGHIPLGYNTAPSASFAEGHKNCNYATDGISNE